MTSLLAFLRPALGFLSPVGGTVWIVAGIAGFVTLGLAFVHASFESARSEGLAQGRAECAAASGEASSIAVEHIRTSVAEHEKAAESARRAAETAHAAAAKARQALARERAAHAATRDERACRSGCTVNLGDSDEG